VKIATGKESQKSGSSQDIVFHSGGLDPLTLLDAVPGHELDGTHGELELPLQG